MVPPKIVLMGKEIPFREQIEVPVALTEVQAYEDIEGLESDMKSMKADIEKVRHLPSDLPVCGEK